MRETVRDVLQRVEVKDAIILKQFDTMRLRIRYSLKIEVADEKNL